jgi:hypothetical protein
VVEERDSDPGFLERGGLRRRLRFLRKTRELAYRDLGGLVFEMHRLGQQREDLLKGKLATLERIDSELRAIEGALQDRHGVTVLREAGVTACPRCAAIHGSEDRFCPACGFSIGHNADRPIAAQPVATPVTASGVPTPAPATATQGPGFASAGQGTGPATATQPTTAAPQPSAAPAQTAAAAPPIPAPAPPPAQSPGATPAPATHRPSPSPSPPQPTSGRAPFPPSAPSQKDGNGAADEGKDQPTEVIEPPTQIIRPGQSNRT